MFELRPYQRAAVSCVLEDIKTYQKVGVILPTGAGKTEVFVDIARQLIADDPTHAVLVLSHLSLLTEQTADRFKLRAPQIQVDIMQRDHQPKWNSQVVISTMQTSRNLKKIEWLREHTVRTVRTIIIDEAHFLPVESYQTILSYFPEAKIIGFTATPYRDRQVMTKIFEKISFSISLQDLIDMSYLVPPKLNEIVSKGETVADVIATVVHLFKTQTPDRQAIVYMQSIDDARMLRSAFEHAGITASAVTQELVGDYRQEILRAFNNGTTRVLTTVNVLTAGFDSPCVGAIFMPYGTSSPTTYLQRIGRGLRPLPGKSDCLVYVFGDAPSVSRRAYEQMTNKILNAGGGTRNYKTFGEDMLYNDYETSSDIYVWNKTVVEAISKMEKLGMLNFASLLNEKRFPKRFMDNIDTLLKNLPAKKSKLPHGQHPATEAQKVTLFKAGFGSEAISSVSKNEASMMIGTILNNSNRSSSQQRFCLPEGTHVGKHVAETPHAYRTLVKTRFPDSPVAKLIIEWESERKRA